MIYEILLREDEMEILKSLAERWLNELTNAYDNIDEMFPLPMRFQVRSDMKEGIKKAVAICEGLGCQVNNLE